MGRRRSRAHCPPAVAVLGLVARDARAGAAAGSGRTTAEADGVAGRVVLYLSKVGPLALAWRRTFASANRVPRVPIVTAPSCLFLAAFVFEAAVADPSVYIAARVLVGLGAVCFTLYSIVGILESGTSSG
ncbi:DUF2776 family protein [Rhodococcus sp. NPDC047139]|uniref:DUF2776 family protein n=1 Tax=Rhodococcus sp. NPDC047139 TaxID=3155141 RepID=UPI0033CAD9A0